MEIIDANKNESSTTRKSAIEYDPGSPSSLSSFNFPNNVSKKKQLSQLPNEFLSEDPTRPLKYIDDHGEHYKYALKPMFYSVIFILMVELLERFSFYGINYTQASYLTGAYDKHWNADMEAVEASSYVSVSTAIAYTAPFLGAFLADTILGEFRAILLGSLVLYLPGLLLIAMTTVPGLLGDTFNKTALRIGLLVLWPIGTGIVKSVVNVFGAKQHHPILQASLIESYYVNFYMCINIGALAGGIIVPIMAQHNITLAYFIPVVILSCGVACFVAGSSRYVRARPHGDLFSKDSDPSDNGLGLSVIARVSMLIVPFNIAYSQMATTFIVQGTVMKRAFGFIDAASMNNADAVSVLLFGYLVGNKFYPALAKRGIKLSTTHKFSIGSVLGTMAIGWALMVEYKIHAAYESRGEKVNILWQSLAYILIGAGEIFAVSAAYETAFTVAPVKKKALASAVNLFFVGGIPNILCIGLYNICHVWFKNKRGNANITDLHDYATAQVAKYFWVLFGIALFGVIINLLPFVRNWVASVEEIASEAIKTPMSTPRSTPKLQQRRKERQMDNEDDEEEPLLQAAKKHQDYLKYGSGPVLYKHGSMRAGMFNKMVKPKPVSLTRYQKYLKYGKGPVLYKASSMRAGVELAHPHEASRPSRTPPRTPPRSAEPPQPSERKEEGGSLLV